MKNLYRLVIIEDEDEIRNGLESIIDWASLGFCVAAGFSSGEEALGWLENNEADVVMTDIRLGGISGLDICRWVHKNRPGVRLVILSGYSDFSYAQQAIDTNVFKYLLKPVDISELYDTYRLLHEEFENSAGSRQIRRHAAQYALRSLLYTLVSESAGAPGLPEPSGFLSDGSYDTGGSWELFRIRCSTVYDRLESDFNSALAADPSCGAASLLLDKVLLVAAVRRTGNAGSADSTEFHERLDRIIDSFSETSGIGMTLLYSNRFTGYYELGNFVKNNFSLKDAAGTSVSMLDLIKAINTYDFDTLENSLPELDRDALKTLGYLLLARQNRFPVLSGQQALPDPGEIPAVRRTEEAVTGQGSAAFLAESIRQLISYCRGGADSSASDIVDRARSYIRSCNGRKVSLNEVAENIYVSPAYLSKEFKRQLGINFKTYVSDASLNCAKELLAGTSVRVREISAQLGFKDVRYFYKYFSEATGLTPTEYRHQNRKTRNAPPPAETPDTGDTGSPE